MPRFRAALPPERQAEAAVGRLVNLGALRRNPNRPPSLRTVANYRACLTRVAREDENVRSIQLAMRLGFEATGRYNQGSQRCHFAGRPRD